MECSKGDFYCSKIHISAACTCIYMCIICYHRKLSKVTVIRDHVVRADVIRQLISFTYDFGSNRNHSYLAYKYCYIMHCLLVSCILLASQSLFWVTGMGSVHIHCSCSGSLTVTPTQAGVYSHPRPNPSTIDVYSRLE